MFRVAALPGRLQTGAIAFAPEVSAAVLPPVVIKGGFRRGNVFDSSKIRRMQRKFVETDYTFWG